VIATKLDFTAVYIEKEEIVSFSWRASPTYSHSSVFILILKTRIGMNLLRMSTLKIELRLKSIVCKFFMVFQPFKAMNDLFFSRTSNHLRKNKCLYKKVSNFLLIHAATLLKHKLIVAIFIDREL
jgi:hypothetical protein